MPKFTEALSTELDNASDADTSTAAETDTTDTTDTADAESTDETADESDDAAESDESESGDEDEDTEADAKADNDKAEKEEDESGSWFRQPKKAPKQAAPQGDKQKKMPDTVRSRIEADVRAKVDAERPWARDWANEEATEARRLWDLGKQDITKLSELVLASAIRQAQSDPVVFNNLKLRLEGLGLTAKTQGNAADDDPPPVLEQTKDGVTAEALAKWQRDTAAWSQRQALKAVDKRMAPLVGDRQSAIRAEQVARQTEAYGKRATANVSERPGFKENIDAIKDAYNKLPRPWRTAQGQDIPNHPQYREESELLLEAYYSVMQAKQAATLKRQKDLAAKNGVSSVNPQGGQGVNSAKKPKSFLDALKQESARKS